MWYRYKEHEFQYVSDDDMETWEKGVRQGDTRQRRLSISDVFISYTWTSQTERQTGKYVLFSIVVVNIQMTI